MARIAVIEDELDHLLEVIGDVRAFDPEGDRIEILPILVKPESPASINAEMAEKRSQLEQALQKQGRTLNLPPIDQSLGQIRVEEPADRERLLSYLAKKRVNLILSDCALGPKLAGLDLLATACDGEWQKQGWECWLMTQHDDLLEKFQTEEVHGRFDPYIRNLYKSPIISNKIDACDPKLQEVLEDAIVREQKREKPQIRTEFCGLYGTSVSMQEVYNQIDRYAESDMSFLITGESGTGKELAAKALHEISRRCNGKFVPVNCSAIPEHLAETHFFGHVKGAFTDARDDFSGVFELADQGTLFLDEIGDLPLSIQPKLLRALQEREIQPIGGKMRAIDVRVIAATNRDISLNDGKFRKDLYYRVAQASVRMPRLKERKEDIPLLASTFLDKFRQEKGLGVKGISPSAMAVLKKWTWPGNVRELESLIKKVVIEAEGGSIDLNCPAIQELREKTARLDPLDPNPRMSVEELWAGVLDGSFRFTLPEWAKFLGDQTTIALTEEAGRYYSRIHPPEKVVIEYFKMEYSAYKAWIHRNNTRKHFA